MSWHAKSITPDPIQPSRQTFRDALFDPVLHAEVESIGAGVVRELSRRYAGGVHCFGVRGTARGVYDVLMYEPLHKTVARKLLGGVLVFAGVSHLTFARRQFQAQVPDWVPLDKDDTVLLSGVAEVVLGSSIVLAGPAQRKTVGRVAAAFFIGVFPGNWSQYVHRRSAFGLDSDNKRFVRLFLQPALVYWALKST